MRPRPGSAHAEAVARRLELLSAELAAVRGEGPPPGPDPEQIVRPREAQHTRVRPRPAAGAGGRIPAAPPEVSDEAPPIPVPGRHAARRRPGGLVLPVGQVALGPAQLSVVAVVALLGLALTTWWVLRSEPEPIAPVSSGPGLTTPAPASPSATAPTEVVVDVAGKVRRPGIAVLEPGARVVDAIKAAGGVRRGVDTSALNLARVLVDGEQILVGVTPPPGVAASAAADPEGAGGPLVNLNTASATDLERLPGVGPVTAEAIIAFRDEHGPFTAVDQLLDVSGIGEATLAEIAPHATI
jgi:competence protein ComEA